MPCPHCQAATYVSDSRARGGYVRRVRRCRGCSARIVTWESTARPDAIADAAAKLRTLADEMEAPDALQPAKGGRPRLVPTEAAA